MQLFESFSLRDVTFKNRIGVSPMCEYSSEDGFATDWHLVHLGSRAVGGAGLILTEAAAVTADGRISPNDLGLYRDEHVEMLARINAFMEAQGAVPGIQLSHSGRKGASPRPWDELPPKVAVADGGWEPSAPSAIPFSDASWTPSELTETRIAELVRAFAASAKRALAAGFRVIELHGAHGYLIHEFLSPLANRRTDRYGGSFENRIRFAREVTQAVRAVWPERLPLFFRVSATDWLADGWTIEDSIALARVLREDGVDLIDASSGGIVPVAPIPVGPLYQAPFAERIRAEAGIATAAVGLITTAAEAQSLVAEGRADLVLLARELLRQPYWPLHVARELGRDLTWPAQYARAKPR